MNLLKNERGILFIIPLVIFVGVLLGGLVVWALMDTVSKIMLVVGIISVSIVAIVFMSKKAKTVTPAAVTATLLSGSGVGLLVVNESVVMTTVGIKETAMPFLMTLTAFAFIAAGITLAVMYKTTRRGRRR